MNSGTTNAKAANAKAANAKTSHADTANAKRRSVKRQSVKRATAKSSKTRRSKAKHPKPSRPTVEAARVARRFPRPLLEALHGAKILGVRSGTVHRYTGVWVVVVEGRVFVRTWNDKPTGWYRAFRAQPSGTIQIAGRDLKVRAVPVKSVRLRQAVSRAYGEKYPTKGSEQWVRGFAQPEREINTLELVP